MAKGPVYEILTRQEAANRGLTRFFTGQPCKHGHIAPRFVANAGCLDCANRFIRAGRKNPFSHDLIPYAGVTFWRSKRHTPASLERLNKYVQECIRTFDAHMFPPVCETCTGTRQVPDIQSPTRWSRCPDCVDGTARTTGNSPASQDTGP